MDAVTQVPPPANEPVLGYAPGSPERATLQARLAAMEAEVIDLPGYVAGQSYRCGGPEFTVVQPHDHAHVLGVGQQATQADTRAAVDAALAASADWRALSFDDRAAVLLKAADLLAGPWRATLNAATMLGQGKTAQQAEIDSACEMADFFRFNVAFARQILAEQPARHSSGTWNRLDHRPLEGFVLAITPFNFTAIGGNLPTAPALMGNVVVWKPSPTQQLAAHWTMQLLAAAGLPPGVINMVPGDGPAVSEVALADPNLAGIHFTGSTATFQLLWREVAQRLPEYRSYPRLVGETGGKDFVVAHPSADVDVLTTALVRGAFEYSGQKCSAASRAYIPRSVWDRMGKEFTDLADSLPVGDPTDFTNFTGAVIDRKAWTKHARALDRAAGTSGVEILAGGTADDSVGYFVRPTVIRSDDPTDEVFTTEYFGPILGVYVYDDGDWSTVLTQVDGASAYALTGAVIAQDRRAIAEAAEVLRFTAGNFYVNDKPTGAVVGQQPFGGARASGTNDKAGAAQNLLRWTSTRTLKETFVPATDHRYPHMAADDVSGAR
jgi:1-pyrroline-5-carboxylate dehydrogenase